MIYDYVFELPSWSAQSGGIMSTVSVARALRARGHFVAVHFQKESSDMPMDIALPGWFPKCKWAITYSDTPYMTRLLALRRAENVAVYMLSYGMAPVREKFNAVLCPGVTVWCSTKRTQRLIEKDGGKATLIGCGHDWENFYFMAVDHVNTAAIMYHESKAKRYDLAVEVCDCLYKKGRIDNVLIFGHRRTTDPIRVPIAPYKEFNDVNRSQLRELFNHSAVYIMPSVSEGCNKTPAEAALCGCPSVLCDGAIGELYDDGRTCLLAQPDDPESFLQAAEVLLSEPDCGEVYRWNMREITKNWTFDNVAKRIEEETCI